MTYEEVLKFYPEINEVCECDGLKLNKEQAEKIASLFNQSEKYNCHISISAYRLKDKISRYLGMEYISQCTLLVAAYMGEMAVEQQNIWISESFLKKV